MGVVGTRRKFLFGHLRRELTGAPRGRWRTGPESENVTPLPADGKEALGKLPRARCGGGDRVPLPEFCSQVTLSLGPPQGSSGM